MLVHQHTIVVLFSEPSATPELYDLLESAADIRKRIGDIITLNSSSTSKNFFLSYFCGMIMLSSVCSCFLKRRESLRLPQV